MNVISFLKRSLQGSTGGAVAVADDQPLPVALGGAGTAGAPAGAVQTVQSPGSTSKQQTLANGTAITGGFDAGAGAFVTGILMPAGWTAASLSFQASVDNTNWFDVYDRFGVEVVIPAAASRMITIEPTLFLGFRYIKVRSGTTGTPVNQGADRTITLIVNS